MRAPRRSKLLAATSWPSRRVTQGRRRRCVTVSRCPSPASPTHAVQVTKHSASSGDPCWRCLGQPPSCEGYRRHEKVITLRRRSAMYFRCREPSSSTGTASSATPAMPATWATTQRPPNSSKRCARYQAMIHLLLRARKPRMPATPSRRELTWRTSYDAPIESRAADLPTPL